MAFDFGQLINKQLHYCLTLHAISNSFRYFSFSGEQINEKIHSRGKIRPLWKTFNLYPVQCICTNKYNYNIISHRIMYMLL